MSPREARAAPGVARRVRRPWRWIALGGVVCLLAWLALGIYMVRKHAVSAYTVILGCIVGTMIAAAWWFGLQAQGVAIVGLIPQGLPSLTLPDANLVLQLQC